MIELGGAQQSPAGDLIKDVTEETFMADVVDASNEVPVIVVAPSDGWFEKTASNVQEVAARGGKVLLISDDEGIRAVGDLAWKTIALPKVHPFVAPILYAIPIQLLAYHIAALKGTDVDQPRNLAKSVTVE